MRYLLVCSRMHTWTSWFTRKYNEINVELSEAGEDCHCGCNPCQEATRVCSLPANEQTASSRAVSETQLPWCHWTTFEWELVYLLAYLNIFKHKIIILLHCSCDCIIGFLIHKHPNGVMSCCIVYVYLYMLCCVLIVHNIKIILKQDFL